MKFTLIWLMLISLCCFGYATEHLIQQPIKVLTSKDGLLHWNRSEAYRDSHSAFHKEKILDITQFQNQQVLNCFPSNLYQGNTADSSLMVLLHAPNWNTASKTPILLVHGAGDDAFRAWVHPRSHDTPKVIPSDQQGFMQKLVKQDYPVFAINFSHNHGCNYLQAEQIHNAIQIIKAKTGSNKVHVVAHSKGNCAVSLYLADAAQVNSKYNNFSSPFAKDVDTYIQIGAANKGIDVTFRYYTGNIYTLSNNISAPICFHEAMIYGIWKNLYRQDIYYKNPGKSQGNFFPGQSQLLYNLVNDGLPLSSLSYTPGDFNLTMKACYHGGTTAFVASYGIEHAIREGGYTISRLNKRGLDPSVKIVSIYGTNSTIKKIDLGFITIPVGANDYEGDGVLYKHSALYINGLTCRGAQLLGQRGFDQNHLDIARTTEVLNWFISFLP